MTPCTVHRNGRVRRSLLYDRSKSCLRQAVESSLSSRVTFEKFVVAMPAPDFLTSVSPAVSCMRAHLVCAFVAFTAQTAHGWSFYDTNLTNYKTNLCERSEAVVNGSLEIEDALRGVVLTFAAADYDADWFGVGEDGVQSGFHVELMDAMARRAGFEYTIKAIPLDTFSGMSWTEYLDTSTTVYDANLDWWLQTNSRSRMGLRCPFTFLDLSLSASMMMKNKKPKFWDTFWKFASPFTQELWGSFLAASIATTVTYWFIEIKTNQEDLDPDQARASWFVSCCLCSRARRSSSCYLCSRVRPAGV